MTLTPIPILLYHSVSDNPPASIRDFSVPAATFERHLDVVAQAGLTSVTVSQLCDGLTGRGPLPLRPVVLTFDDGWADFASAAVAVHERGLVATLYVTTGFLQGGGIAATTMGALTTDALHWSQLADLVDLGIEIGAHCHAHRQLDVVPLAVARDEIRRSRHLLEETLQQPVRSFAYPHGFSSPAVRTLVVEEGYESACAVKNALSSSNDHVFELARLTVRPATTDDQLDTWLAGSGARLAPFPERPLTRMWRGWRRARYQMTRRPHGP